MAAAAARGRGVPAALRAAIASGAVSARIEEALLQIVPFAGFPRAIEAFGHLRRLAPAASVRRGRGDGGRAFRRVYGRDSGRILRRLRGLHPDLAEWVIADGYGRVLARGGLTLRERELLAVAALAALGGGPVLEGHRRGARRAGATAGEVAAALAAGGQRTRACLRGLRES